MMASENGRDTLKTLGKRNKYLTSVNIFKFLIIIITITISSVKSVYQSSDKC